MRIYSSQGRSRTNCTVRPATQHYCRRLTNAQITHQPYKPHHATGACNWKAADAHVSMKASSWRSYQSRPVAITGQQVAETAGFISRNHEGCGRTINGIWFDCNAKVFLPRLVGFVRELWLATVQRYACSLTTISPNAKSGKNQHEGIPIQYFAAE
jgi:hypothetical protein